MVVAVPAPGLSPGVSRCRDTIISFTLLPISKIWPDLLWSGLDSGNFPDSQDADDLPVKTISETAKGWGVTTGADFVSCKETCKDQDALLRCQTKPGLPVLQDSENS